MIVIAGTIPIKAEHREEAQQLALWMATETRAFGNSYEPGGVVLC